MPAGRGDKLAASGPQPCSSALRARGSDGRLRADMSPTLRRLLASLAVLGTGVALAAVALLDPEPAVALQTEPEAQDIARALALLRTHDPRAAAGPAQRSLWLRARELDVLAGHAAARRGDVSARVQLASGAALVQACVQLPGYPLAGLAGRWLNIEARLVQTAGQPVLDSWQVGRVPLPAALGRALWQRGVEHAGFGAEWQLVADIVQRVEFKPDGMRVDYAWQTDSAQRALAALVPPDEQARLVAYHTRLAELTHALPPGDGTVALISLLPPLFDLARERSAATGNGFVAENSDRVTAERSARAAAENRSALLALTLYASGRSLSSLLRGSADAAALAQPRPLRLLLVGREDFPLHLLVSATLAAEVTGALSQAVGLSKEVADSRRGSGFSFNDMAANRVGTRLGELAMRDPAALQKRLARGVAEEDLMPPWADLPEFLPEAEFKRRFGGVGEAPYLALMAEIERRVAALPLLR